MNFITRFGHIKIITPNIAEIVINHGIEVSLEIVEEYEALMSEHFSDNYATLINRINNYSYAYEALLCVGSAKNLKAVAVINYGLDNEKQSKNVNIVQHIDKLNIKLFSGLELGRAHAIDWLNAQLTKASNNAKVE